MSDARPRIIPCLLLRQGRLVKGARFRDHRYVGDPMNALHIFNEKEADELILLDIDAHRTAIDWALLEQLASECFMPVCYGGGIRSVADARRLLRLGFEKIAVNTAGIAEPELLRALAAECGSQAVVAAVDVGTTWLGRRALFARAGRERRSEDVVAWCQRVEQLGAGEILLTSIERDGTSEGYDLELVRQVTAATKVPVVAAGGAGSLAHMAAALAAGASAAAAGSLFVLHGKNRAVLITYPRSSEIDALAARS